MTNVHAVLLLMPELLAVTPLTCIVEKVCSAFMMKAIGVRLAAEGANSNLPFARFWILEVKMFGQLTRTTSSSAISSCCI